MIFPEEDAFEEVYTNVDFSWNSVPNATHYYFQASIIPSFFLVTEDHIISDTTITITSLLKNKNYYWRVWAFNQSAVCGEFLFSESSKFSTGDLENVNDLEKNKLNITISPNPISQNNNSVNVLLEKPLQNAQVEIFNLNGQNLFEKRIDFINSGWSNLWTENEVTLQKGVYFLTLKTENHMVTKKFVIF